MTKPGQFTAMISSTSYDLPEHRKSAIEACLKERFFPLGMEHLPTRDATGVRVSLEMVDQADVYIGVFAWRYGWVPEFDNPKKISITEMEFNRAIERQKKGELKEILIFIMDDKHPIIASDKEDGKGVQRKLAAFKRRASTGRGVSKFKSKDELEKLIVHALSQLRFRLEPNPVPETGSPIQALERDNSIPTPPDFYAEPHYIGSHTFVGRDSQLQELSDWAKSADQTNLLLFEAIGGNGKSMLTWEWATNHAPQVRSDWAGRFWYSFYERGAVMADFCQRALAYMTGQPLEALQKQKTAQLKDQLLAQLHAKPWLLILDGLERVLVAYHRIDAAEVPDEEVNIPTDKVLDRNPCDAIRDEDSDLLRALAAAKPSKILVSSRLTPRVLLNKSGQPINGARRITLPGLRPADAEQLLRSCGIEGDSQDIQKYLTENCDNHPLVIGILAGLINDYMPKRGNFDCWSHDPQGGGQLNLADLSIIQRRNHILLAALEALAAASRQLLSTIALLSKAVDFETLKAFNPHLPPEPKEVEKPESPEKNWRWSSLSEEEMAKRREKYAAALVEHKDYEQALKVWRESAEFRAAPAKLGETIKDLEQRGLLQYDGRERRYDLHPVVRAVAAGRMPPEDKQSCGQRVVDHFTSQPHSPYEQAQTLEDVENGLHVVRTLLKLGRYQQAAGAYRGDLSIALFFNLEGHGEALSLLRPFFPNGWDRLPQNVNTSNGCYLANDAAIALHTCGEFQPALSAYGAALRGSLKAEDWHAANAYVLNISGNLSRQNLLAKSLRVIALALDLATVREDDEYIFMSRLFLFTGQSLLGQWQAAEAIWRLLDPMGRGWSRGAYRQGKAEEYYARFQFWRGNLQEEHLTAAATLAEQDGNRFVLRRLHWLRGAWRLEQGDWAPAAASFDRAVTMAREVRLVDEDAETGLALAKFHLQQLPEPRQEAARLAQLRHPSHRYLALLWHAIGDSEQAKHHALAAYQWAWADGEPYVNRYELTKSTELLQQLHLPIPQLPPYDPTQDKPFPWEADVRTAIEKLRAKQKAKKAKREEKATEAEGDAE